MNLIRWNKIYENNKRLDEIFIEKYQNDTRLYDKNCIELMVEIGEFVNETKVFKYWSSKLPNKEKVLEEYADVITITLTFFREYNLEIKENYSKIEESDILNLIMDLYDKSYQFWKDNDKEILEEIFSYTLYIGKHLEFKEDEILDAIERKQKIIEERLNSNY